MLIAAATALALVAPAYAKVIQVAPGENAQTRLQEALILAEPGDVVELGAGRFVLTDGLSLDVKGVTLRGAGMEATVLDFTGQKGSGEGLLVTSDEVTLRDFAVENTKGDGIKSKGADNIVYYRVRVTWTGGAKTTNGAYGIYPVESTGVLIDGCKVSGASDAGIYVGQSKDITVRYSLAEFNVAGIEIENSRNAIVHGNLATRNTGGILVFDLPNLPVMGGGNTVVENNLVIDNDTPNFAPKGNIVAGVPRGTGVMVMANETVVVRGNTLANNPTAQIMVLAYPNAFDDQRYNPYPRRIVIGANTIIGGGYDPQLPGGDQLKAAFGGALPPLLWDGLGGTGAIVAGQKIAGLSLNLPAQGVSPDQARPAPFELAPAAILPIADGVGAPAALEARIAR
ncbi:parallel beta-helix domain-containing protein [Novosphingobium sp.]|uniref:parallel beta-helix domain-containing protein n=1 Tax=Novosphingobium sp. TaxID=1874826 RepID=UPI0022C761FF|nr:parallel beta-helix domain-containing protein [Novosphingobium sp.]MCZ8019638.1 right-handed parallel beta-helix repeat-containing protein [Novosphingobium sp.]MCZ8035453.1 right-handed parallel beta-helix repeat-containing protein [Novosphingobium sp.]MCZ8050767.1 right-handed parallel beta-helix repeat-containing protein [Novosphingobium sp.]MCZ8059113.1 right-handed parallel beta-helix repeat-containing protein [Novosphingobium sp.]MCZ8232559.1 right-handed parallel beta-helix repeat-con